MIKSISSYAFTQNDFREFMKFHKHTDFDIFIIKEFYTSEQHKYLDLTVTNPSLICKAYKYAHFMFRSYSNHVLIKYKTYGRLFYKRIESVIKQFIEVNEQLKQKFM